MTLVGRPAENHPQQVRTRGALDRVDDRRTPREVFEPLDDEFKFTIDVAASSENTLCGRFFDIEADGLAHSWDGERVWCNPPYSNIAPWVKKAATSETEIVVMLLPANRCEQAWWQDFIEPRQRDGRIELRFLRGRLRFETPAHDYTRQPKGNRPPFGVVVVIWRNE